MSLDGVTVTDVAFDPVDVGRQVVGPAFVDLRIERVEDAYLVAGREQAIDEVRADEASATCDQYTHPTEANQGGTACKAAAAAVLSPMSGKGSG
jgi:hypothetical protein